jgi:hypothetical protein
MLMEWLSHPAHYVGRVDAMAHHDGLVWATLPNMMGLHTWLNRSVIVHTYGEITLYNTEAPVCREGGGEFLYLLLKEWEGCCYGLNFRHNIPPLLSFYVYQTDGRMDDGTDGWNDASQRPLLYVIPGCSPSRVYGFGFKTRNPKLLKEISQNCFS